MLQQFDDYQTCDTTSTTLNTPFSVKDILNMNIANDGYYGVKKEPTDPLYPPSGYWDPSYVADQYNYGYVNSTQETIEHGYDKSYGYCGNGYEMSGGGTTTQYLYNNNTMDNSRLEECEKVESPSKYKVCILIYYKQSSLV